MEVQQQQAAAQMGSFRSIIKNNNLRDADDLRSNVMRL